MLRGIMAVPDCPTLYFSMDEGPLINTYNDTRAFLETKHGVVLLEDQLHEWLKRLGLKQQGSESSLEKVEAAIQISKN